VTHAVGEPTPLARPLLWPALVIAVLLAGLTGFVDAVAYDRFLGVFPANQSGNAVFLGTSIGGSPTATGWQSGTSMAAFALGIVAAELVRRRGARGPRIGAWLLAGEFVLLASVVAIAGPIDGSHVIGGGEGYALIVLTSMAMGVQTLVIRHVAGTSVVTTYQTGAIARMGESVSKVLTRAARLREQRELAVLLLVLATYVAGAAVGAAAPGTWRWAMVLPVAVVAAIAVAWFLAPWRVVGPDDA
jgi:uncharacterized membrane protein YoaK (UPF0700 family)